MQYPGAGKIFVSITESGSWDYTKRTLIMLKIRLEVAAVQRSIVSSGMDGGDTRESLDCGPRLVTW